VTAQSIADLAIAVNAAIARVPEDGRFGPRKVFVSAIWAALIAGGYRSCSFERFKAQLIAAQRARLLSLARADLVAAMPAATVAASEIVHDGATYHFVIDERARDPWA
jgi:hypothetical protein